MAAQPYTGLRSAADAQPGVDVLAQNFDRDPSACKQQIRQILDDDPESFYSGAVRVVRMPNQSRGVQFVVGLLMESNLLMKALCDPALSRQEASRLARLALQVNPAADLVMVEQLAASAPAGASVALASRLLDILADVSTGTRIHTSLMRLLQPIISTALENKCKPDWRSRQSVKWVQSRMADPDPRARANAVEALWGLESAEAKELLRTAARDSNNRVAGNALFGLHTAGDPWAFPELQKMAGSPLPLFRASAAWVMGQSGDPRFSETLARMVGESNRMVRKRAFSALAQLKKAAQAREGSEWRIGGGFVPGSGNHRRQLRVEIRPASGGTTPKLLPTQFILLEDGQLIHQYQVEERVLPEPLALTFVLPAVPEPSTAPWIRGALNCLSWKRAPDLWRTVLYAPTPGRSEAFPGAVFTSVPETAAQALEAAPGKICCTDFWSALRHAMQPANWPSRGSGAIILYCEPNTAPPDDAPEILSSAINSHIALHAIIRTHSPYLEELALGSRGSYEVAGPASDLPRLVEDMHVRLLARYSVSYQPLSPDPRPLTIRAFNAAGSGEATILPAATTGGSPVHRQPG